MLQIGLRLEFFGSFFVSLWPINTLSYLAELSIAKQTSEQRQKAVI